MILPRAAPFASCPLARRTVSSFLTALSGRQAGARHYGASALRPRRAGARLPTRTQRYHDEAVLEVAMRARPLAYLLAALLLGATACAAPASAPKPAAAPTAAQSAAPAGAPSGGAAASGNAAPGAATSASSSASAAPAAPPERIAVRYGYNPILGSAPLFVAQERGYFDEQGIDVEYTAFDSAALMVAPLSASQLDIIMAVPSPSQLNALARDIDMRAVAAQSSSTTGLLVRKELVESGQVRTLADLRGRRVSFNIEGSAVDYTLRVALGKQGMRLDDVEVQRVVNTDLAAALANGATDAGVVPEPLPTLIEQRGVGVRFLDVQELAGPQS